MKERHSSLILRDDFHLHFCTSVGNTRWDEINKYINKECRGDVKWQGETEEGRGW